MLSKQNLSVVQQLLNAGAAINVRELVSTLHFRFQCTIIGNPTHKAVLIADSITGHCVYCPWLFLPMAITVSGSHDHFWCLQGSNSTVLHHACPLCSAQLVRLLLDAGAYVASLDSPVSIWSTMCMSTCARDLHQLSSHIHQMHLCLF